MKAVIESLMKVWKVMVKDIAHVTGESCLHAQAYVSRRLGKNEVAIEFELHAPPACDGKIVEQVYHRDLFIDGKLPQEGDRGEVYIFMCFHPPEPADALKYLAPEEIEARFPGFQKKLDDRRDVHHPKR